MKGKYFLAKPPHGDLNYVHISHYQSTEHDSEQYCATFCGHGALHISSAADMQSSGIVNQHAQGRGLGAVEADPMLSNRRKRRFSSIGSATNILCKLQRIVGVSSKLCISSNTDISEYKVSFQSGV